MRYKRLIDQLADQAECNGLKTLTQCLSTIIIQKFVLKKEFAK